ncbi:hypothetical protein ABW19_dt0209082 [Dactylella cylindrospora]|nr:hypothetical protein ABW19_dt0209082 [Dactylella cylindrospora]
MHSTTYAYNETKATATKATRNQARVNAPLEMSKYASKFKSKADEQPPAYTPGDATQASPQQKSFSGNTGELLDSQVKRKRDEYYSKIWAQYTSKEQWDDVITVVDRYIDIIQTSPSPSWVATDAYYALATACGKLKRSQKALTIFDRSRPRDRTISVEDMVHIRLLKALAYLDLGNTTEAKATLEGSLEEADKHLLGGEYLFILGLIAAYQKDFVEAAFYRSMLPADFKLGNQLQSVLKSLSFKSARWEGANARFGYGERWDIDFSRGLPIPARYDEIS